MGTSIPSAGKNAKETLVLDRVMREIEERPVLFHAMNALVALVWGWYAYRAISGFAAQGHEGKLISILMIAMNFLLILFYLLRRRSKAVASDLVSIVLGHVGTWLPNFFEAPSAEWPPVHPAVTLPCTLAMVISLWISLLGYLSLGRSWGIIPANRGVKKDGLYRFVRHPIYASYLVFDWAYVLTAPSPRNWAVVVMLTLALYARARLEERVLRRDPAYAEYAERTRSMFIPGVI
jgi:protein-S-isoprenylcysteine O-methyltransferase Ste14